MALTMNPELKWHSRPVLQGSGKINDLRQDIPRFAAVPFKVEDGGVNKYLNLIVREPLKVNEGYLLQAKNQDELEIPVATVSKQYELVQHRRIVEVLETVLNQIGFDSNLLETTLTLSEYGERMWASFTLPEKSPYAFDLGSGLHVLQVNALNSVDKTAALEINLTWYSLDSQTGMLARQDRRLKKIHVKSRKSLEYTIKEFLGKQLRQALGDIRLFQQWFEIEVAREKFLRTKPTSGQIEQWIDEIVTKKWGIIAAARVYQIAKTGYDGKVEEPHQRLETPQGKAKAHEYELHLIERHKVPGAFAPVRNAYDISQVLSWLAKHQGTIQGQLERMMEIPTLMNSLLRQKKSLTLST